MVLVLQICDGCPVLKCKSAGSILTSISALDVALGYG